MKRNKMKKIDKMKLEKEKEAREFLRRIEYERMKRGITKTKDDYEETKAKKYVRNINEMYNLFGIKKHIEITKGTKKEGIKHCNTKSQWKYKREELEKEGKVKPEILEIKDNSREKLEKKRKEIKLPRRKEKVFLVIGKNIFTKEIEIEPSEEMFETEIKLGKEKKEITLRRTYLEKEETYETKYGEMKGKTILEISISTGVKIYEMKQ